MQKKISNNFLFKKKTLNEENRFILIFIFKYAEVKQDLLPTQLNLYHHQNW